MKKLLFFAIALLTSLCAVAQENEFATFPEITHDFGEVHEEVGKVTYVFKFVNVLQTPLTITNVRASCGCTTPSYSKVPIAPNEEGEITVTYSARGRVGAFHKSITVTLTNGVEEFQKVLYIKGKVLQAEQPIQTSPAQTTPAQVRVEPVPAK